MIVMSKGEMANTIKILFMVLDMEHGLRNLTNLSPDSVCLDAGLPHNKSAHPKGVRDDE